MERQLAALIQQVTEMTDRLRLNEELAEQVRQLLEAHKTAGQMLEERMNRTDASVRGVQAGVSEELAEQVRQLLEAHRTAGQMLEERMDRTEASVRDTSQAGGSSAARAQKAPGADDGRCGFGAFAARYQPENFNGEDTGWRVWSRVFRAWAGRLQRGRVQEIITAVEARPGDEATVAELDLRLEDWASAELKSVAADFYHALILFCNGKALKIVLTNKEGEGFEAWRALVNKYEPTSKASVVGKLAETLRTPFDVDLLDATHYF